MSSLKYFHIAFISISILFCIFFGYWSYNESLILYLILSIISSIVLLIYGTMFYYKLDKL